MSAIPIPIDSIDRMTSTALSGDLNTAIAELQKSGLNEEQKAKVSSILNELRSEIEQPIIAAVGEENTASTAPFLSASQSLQKRSHCLTTELNSDIIGLLCSSYFSKCDFTTIIAAAGVNKLWYSCSTNFWTGVDLKQLCPELTILDAETQGVMCEDEPKISKLQLFKWVREISPHVEGNAGVTQLTMTKGTTLNQLIDIAQGEGITVDTGPNIIEELGDVPVERTYGILITNSVFKNSRNKDVNSQIILLEGHGCVMPTVQEYVALCVLTEKVLKKCLYGYNPMTYGCSSAQVENYPVIVGGGSTHLRFRVATSAFDSEQHGAGGQRKFENATS